MSRNNVFKLSGNMALGGGDQYPNDLGDIKSSLKLLKAKQQRNQEYTPPSNQYAYGESYSSNLPQRNQPSNKNNYQQNAKNHIPPNYKETSGYNYKDSGYNQPEKNGRQPENYGRQPESYGRQQPNYGSSNNIQQRQPENYGRKPQNYGRQVQNYERQPQNYGRQAQNYGRKPQNNGRKQQTQNYGRKPQNYGRQVQNSGRQQPNYGNNKNQPSYQYNEQKPTIEKSIKEINKENRVDIIEYDPSELMECRAGCGRKFNPDSIKKHQGVCKKVFQKKRKEFNAQEHRLVNKDQKKFMKIGEVAEKKIEQIKARQKVPKWKAESMQLRAGLKAAQGSNYTPTREEQAILDQSKQQSTVRCHVCGRTFSDQAGQRHIPFCEAQNKKNALRKK